MEHMDIEFFQTLSTDAVAEIVRSFGSKVVVFPINGTRRWFRLEYGGQDFEDPITAYMDIGMKRHIELYKLIFDHGIDTLLTPIIGPEILESRDAYMQKIGAEGLARLATHPEMLSFYMEYDVRVRFYGEYRNYLSNTGHKGLIDLFDQITLKTKKNKKKRLFFGAFADQLLATETVASFAVKYHAQHGAIPNRREIIEMYYGEYIEKVNIFIGFDRFAAFDYPLLNWGEEDLYFTISPSLYMTPTQFRRILYDHIYTRRENNCEYDDLGSKDQNWIKNFYNQNRLQVVGVGNFQHGIWYPLSEVIDPDQECKAKPHEQSL